MVTRYRNRSEAGRFLATFLHAYYVHQDLFVLALPRGGVPVAYEVAKALSAPLDLFLVRKLGVPGHEELALGAIASGGIRVLNDDVVHSLHIPGALIESITVRERQELQRRERLYRDQRPYPSLHDRIVILIDDGLATGASMRAAIRALRQQQPARLVVAVPVAAPQTCHELRAEVDDLICAQMPLDFYGVGWWYDDFSQTTDQEVRTLLARAAREIHAITP